jgi:serine/threonine protein phosphatase PrpC
VTAGEHAWAGATLRGADHDANEDALSGDARGVWLVVDGFGGDRSGAYAAELVVAELGEPGDVREQLAAARARLSERISPNGAGATIVRVAIAGDRAEVAWLGVCRAHLLRDGAISPLTRDHSLVAELIAAGRLTPEEAADSPFKNMMTRVVMGCRADEPEVVHVALRPGDRLLMTSDGVCEVLDEATLLEVVLAAGSPEAAVQAVIAGVAARRARDDATALMVAFRAGPA